MRSMNAQGAVELTTMRLKQQQKSVPQLAASFTMEDRHLVGKIQAFILGLEAPNVPTYHYPQLDPDHMTKLIVQHLSLTDTRFRNFDKDMYSTGHPWIAACMERVKEVL